MTFREARAIGVAAIAEQVKRSPHMGLGLVGWDRRAGVVRVAAYAMEFEVLPHFDPVRHAFATIHRPRGTTHGVPAAFPWADEVGHGRGFEVETVFAPTATGGVEDEFAALAPVVCERLVALASGTAFEYRSHWCSANISADDAVAEMDAKGEPFLALAYGRDPLDDAIPAGPFRLSSEVAASSASSTFDFETARGDVYRAVVTYRNRRNRDFGVRVSIEKRVASETVEGAFDYVPDRVVELRTLDTSRFARFTTKSDTMGWLAETNAVERGVRDSEWGVVACQPGQFVTVEHPIWGAVDIRRNGDHDAEFLLYSHELCANVAHFGVWEDDPFFDELWDNGVRGADADVALSEEFARRCEKLPETLTSSLAERNTVAVTVEGEYRAGERRTYFADDTERGVPLGNLDGFGDLEVGNTEFETSSEFPNKSVPEQTRIVAERIEGGVSERRFERRKMRERTEVDRTYAVTVRRVDKTE